MDFTYISNNKTADKDIRYNIPGHFSIATFYTSANNRKCIMVFEKLKLNA